MQLIDVAEVMPGYPFRGRIEPASDGEAIVVQLKDSHPVDGISWTNVISARLEARRVPDWLRDGDILFAAKGAWHKAVLVTGAPDSAVCAPNFYHLRVSRPDLITPEYLTWALNQESAQAILEQSAEGSQTLSIKRKDLERIAIPVPPLHVQRWLVGLLDSAREERNLMLQLIKNRDEEVQALTTQVLSGAIVVPQRVKG